MPDSPPQQRIVLLGASNVAKSISTAAAVAQQAVPGPIDLMAAMGHGRAYSCDASALGRYLPAIVDCQLWSDLAARPPARLQVVLMDVGNDILYGRSADELCRSIDTCLDRCEQFGAKITIVGLPLETLAGLAPWRFHFFRRLFFPRSTLTYSAGMEIAKETHQRLKQRAADRRYAFLEQPTSWYGLDPIHLKRACWREAWKKIFSLSEDRVDQPPIRGSLKRFLYLRSRCPAYRKLLWLEQRAAQPSGRLPGGIDISWY